MFGPLRWCRPLARCTRVAPFRIQRYQSAFASAAATKADPPLRCTIFDDKGKVTQVAAHLDRKRFIRDYGLHSRDLRHVDSQQSTLVPSILVHNGQMLVSICDLRVLIRHNQVLVFHSRDPKVAERLSMLVYDFTAKLGKRALNTDRDVYHDRRQTYEQTALEIVLVHAMAYLEVELNLMLKDTDYILRELEANVDRELLGELLVRSKKLQAYHRKCIAVRNALGYALDDVPDLQDMYYAEHPEKRAAQSQTPKPSSPQTKASQSSSDAKPDSKTNASADSQSSISDVNDIEILLETYYKEADELVQKAGKTVRDVSLTEEVVNIMIDANRNSLLLFRLEVSVVTVGFTIALFFATLYGMNLENFVEDTNYGLALVTGSLVAISILVTIYNFRRLRLTEKVFIPSRKTGVSDAMSLWLKTAKHTPAERPVLSSSSMPHGGAVPPKPNKF